MYEMVHSIPIVREALLRGLQQILQQKGWPEADNPEKITEGLQKIIALNPGVLEMAISSVVSKSAEVQEADPIPKIISSPSNSHRLSKMFMGVSLQILIVGKELLGHI